MKLRCGSSSKLPTMSDNKQIIESKRHNREVALASAPKFVSNAHELYLHATGGFSLLDVLDT